MDILFQNTKFLIGQLGPGAAGSTTVGYTIYNQFGNEVVARTTDGVIELSNGDFGASIAFEPVTFQLNFVGFLQWDDGISATFNDSINIVSDTSENVLMLLDRNIEYEFEVATVADPSRNVLVGMYDGVTVRHKLNTADNFDNPIFSDLIRFSYKKAAFDSDVVRKSIAEEIDGYGGGYGYGY